MSLLQYHMLYGLEALPDEPKALAEEVFDVFEADCLETSMDSSTYVPVEFTTAAGMRFIFSDPGQSTEGKAEPVSPEAWEKALACAAGGVLSSFFFLLKRIDPALAELPWLREAESADCRGKCAALLRNIPSVLSVLYGDIPFIPRGNDENYRAELLSDYRSALVDLFDTLSHCEIVPFSSSYPDFSADGPDYPAFDRIDYPKESHPNHLILVIEERS